MQHDATLDHNKGDMSFTKPEQGYPGISHSVEWGDEEGCNSVTAIWPTIPVAIDHCYKSDLAVYSKILSVC